MHMLSTPTDGDHPTVTRRGPVWGRISAQVLRDPDLTPQAKALYALLATYADNGGRDCWPNQQTLADQLGVSVDTIQRQLRVLEDAGVVETNARYSDSGGRLSNAYVLLDTLADAPPPQRPTNPRKDAGSVPRKDAAHPPRMDAAPRTEPGEQNQVNTYAADAAIDGMLFAVPDPASASPPQTAQTLVARWCDGYRSANGGGDAPTPMMKRVAGQMKNLAKGCATDADWNTAWRAAYTAGQNGHADAVPYTVNTRSRFKDNRPRNYDLEALMGTRQPTLPAVDPGVAMAMRMLEGRA